MNRLSSINSGEAPGVGKTPIEKPVVSTASQQLDDLMASLHDFHVNVNNTRVCLIVEFIRRVELYNFHSKYLVKTLLFAQKSIILGFVELYSL